MTPPARSAVPEPTVSPDELGRILSSRKATAEFKILRATRALLASSGLGISMDAIAVEAGISRRTLFRHFPVRDELVARALRESLDFFHGHVAETFESSGEIRHWLRSVVSALHTMQIGAGRGIWQMAASEDSELPASIAAVNADRRRTRQETTVVIAREAWKRAGQPGDVPREVEIMFALAFSSFAARSLNFDYGANQEETVNALAEMLAGYLESIATTR